MSSLEGNACKDERVLSDDRVVSFCMRLSDEEIALIKF